MPTHLPLLRWPVLLLVWLLIDACEPPGPAAEPADKRNGFRPVYATDKTPTVTTKPPQPLQRPGKIYVRGSYLLVNEQNKGLHVIDNRNPAKPVAMSFIDIPGNYDMALKDSTLYANSGSDLLALNISDPANIRLAKKLDILLPAVNIHPSATGVWFECVDPARGLVVGWEPAQLTNPKCYR